MSKVEEKRVLCVGLCCLDIINVVESFPKEDTDQRSLDYYWQKGGNAANTSSVLGALGANVEFFGTFVRGQEYEFLKKDMASYGVCIENCVIHEDGVYKCPVAVAIINKENGSRTIMAALNIKSAADNMNHPFYLHVCSYLAEVSFEEFDSNIQLSNYSWIHFEGRPNVSNIRKMAEKIALYNSRLPEEDRIAVSIELEKPKRRELESLFNLVDVIFLSKEYAQENGYISKEEAVVEFLKISNYRCIVICAWGEDGAAGSSKEQGTVNSTIFPPEELIDTLGAGDTFNAATIHALNNRLALQDAVTLGCKVAGAKCGMHSYKGLEKFRNQF